MIAKARTIHHPKNTRVAIDPATIADAHAGDNHRHPMKNQGRSLSKRCITPLPSGRGRSS